MRGDDDGEQAPDGMRQVFSMLTDDCESNGNSLASGHSPALDPLGVKARTEPWVFGGKDRWAR